MVLLALLAVASTEVTLDAVYRKVKELPGVEISAEMVRPSSIAMTFKVAPGGHLWAKYPTSEDFVNLKERVTWLPDRRQFGRSKLESLNPVPGGFEPLWPNGALPTANGKPTKTTFAGKPAIEIPRKAPAGYDSNLYVDPSSLLPMGTIATANGTTFEVRYLSVKIAPIAPDSISFVAPPDAKPLTNEAPDSKLPKPGTKISLTTGKDLHGRPVKFGGKQGVVLNFWFSSCTGCIQEMPYLRELDTRLKDHGIQLVGVNPIDPIANARKTSETNRLSFPTLVGAEAKRLAKDAGLIAYPVTIVLSPDGTVVDAILGLQKDRLTAALQKIGFKD